MQRRRFSAEFKVRVPRETTHHTSRALLVCWAGTVYSHASGAAQSLGFSAYAAVPLIETTTTAGYRQASNDHASEAFDSQQ